jgi:hypothetical protein
MIWTRKKTPLQPKEGKWVIDSSGPTFREGVFEPCFRRKRNHYDRYDGQWELFAREDVWDTEQDALREVLRRQMLAVEEARKKALETSRKIK